MPEQYNLNISPVPEQRPPQQTKQLHLLLLIGIPALFIIFFAGLIFGRLSSPKPQSATTSIVPSPTQAVISQPQITPNPTIISEIPAIQFLPQKQYLDDTYVVVAKDAPHQTLILSASRIEQERNFSQYTKVNYFDGKVWDHKTATTINPSNNISINTLLRSWKITPATSDSNPIHQASIQLATQSVSISTNDLQNEISIQSTPGLTKFIYQGTGSMLIGTETHPAYVLYSRTYSFNAADLSYLTRPESLTSDWLLFWDKEGTFYYYDARNPNSSDSSVSQFNLALDEDAKRTVVKTTSVKTNFSTANGISSYHADLDTPISQELILPLTNPLSKSDKKTYTWITNTSEGTVVKREGRTVAGVGVVEYIRKN